MWWTAEPELTSDSEASTPAHLKDPSVCGCSCHSVILTISGLEFLHYFKVFQDFQTLLKCLFKGRNDHEEVELLSDVICQLMMSSWCFFLLSNKQTYEAKRDPSVMKVMWRHEHVWCFSTFWTFLWRTQELETQCLIQSKVSEKKKKADSFFSVICVLELVFNLLQF